MNNLLLLFGLDKLRVDVSGRIAEKLNNNVRKGLYIVYLLAKAVVDECLKEYKMKG